jgi:hypothetical protein
VAVVTTFSLFLVAKDKPSSRSDHPNVLETPIVSNAAGCSNFAAYWTADSDVQVDASVIEGLTNCWQAADGSWIVPTGPNDPRLPAGFKMTQPELQATNSLRQNLVAEMAGLEQSLSTSMQRDLSYIYDPRVRPVTGHLKDGIGITRARSRYTRVIQAFLMAPENKDLANYVGWLMARKFSAYDTLDTACLSDSATAYLKTVCSGLEDSLSVRFPPFLWDLRNSVSLEAYLANEVRTNQLPSEASTHSEVPAAADLRRIGPA